MSLVKDVLNSCGCCAVLALDIKNAFYFANWGSIKGFLADFGVPGCLSNLTSEKELTERIWAQKIHSYYGLGTGSPNAILVLPVPEKAMIVDFAGDLAAAKCPENVKVCATETLRALKTGMKKDKKNRTGLHNERQKEKHRADESRWTCGRL